MAGTPSDTQTTEFHAHELNGEIILGHGISDCPDEAFDMVRDDVDDLNDYKDGDHVATVVFNDNTDEITNFTLTSPGGDE